ncbi:MAG: hypothetical protein WAW23_01485, partial [Candidatus Methanoperedens sp.]
TYTFFKICDKVVPFLLLPIITRALEPQEFGMFILFQAIAGVVLPFMTLSVDSSILLNYFKVKPIDFKEYFSSGYFLLLISSLVVSLGIYATRVPIARLTEFPSQWVIVTTLFCFFQFHSNLALNMFQVRREPQKYGIYSLSLTITKNLLMLLLIFVFGMKWEGMILGYLGGHALFSALGLLLFKKDKLFSKNIRRDFLVDNMKVGYPLSLHQMGAWAASSATRVVVAGLLGSAATGSFGVGAAFGMVVLFVQDSFNKAFTPYLFEKLNDFNDTKESQMIKLTYIYNICLLSFATLMGLCGYLFIDVLFGHMYSAGKVVVFFMSLAYAFEGMYKMHVNYIFYTKKTHLILLITMTSGALNIILSYYFIKFYGLMGASLSLFVINVCCYLLAWYIGNHVFPMRWFQFKVSMAK